MANPQKENGFTQVANEILEALGRQNLSPYEARVLFIIIRKTYGYQKKEDAISLSQIDSFVKVGRAAVSRSIAKLESKAIIVVDRSNQTSVIKFNKNHDEWASLSIFVYRDVRPWHRDTSVCEFCKEHPRKHKHHIIPRGVGGRDITENYAYLCEECHEKIHEYMKKTVPDEDIASYQSIYNRLIKYMAARPKENIWPWVDWKPVSSEYTTGVSSGETTGVSSIQVSPNDTTEVSPVQGTGVSSKQGNTKERVKESKESLPPTADTTTDPLITPSLVFDYAGELKKIEERISPVHRIAGQLLQGKGHVYKNKDQFNAAFTRALRPAQQLKGYSREEIDQAIEITKKQASELGFDWQPQTVVKNIERVANRPGAPNSGYSPDVLRARRLAEMMGEKVVEA